MSILCTLLTLEYTQNEGRDTLPFYSYLKLEFM